MTDTMTLTGDEFEEMREQTIAFLRPLIGFPSSRRFSIRSLGAEYAPFTALTSLDEEGLSFVVVPPGTLYRDYLVEIPEADVALLGLTGTGDVKILVLVTRRDGSSPTANLMGPVVVNRKTGEALQVVLADSGYGVTVAVDAGTARP